MKIETKTSKEYSVISYVSLIIGILCFLFVFVNPTAIANVGNVIGDYITAILSGLGIILSVMAMTKKTEKKLIPIVSLILSSSFILFWIIMFILLLTGQIEFAP